MNLLNSPVVNKLLKFGLSKAGMAVSLVAGQVAGWIVVKLGLPAILTPENLQEIQGGLTEGATMFGMALTASFYAWITERQKAGVKVMQSAINASENNPVTVNVDGIAGNATVAAQAKIADVPVNVALAGVDKS